MKTHRKSDIAYKDLGGIELPILDKPEDYFIGNVCKYFPVATKTKGNINIKYNYY